MNAGRVQLKQQDLTLAPARLLELAGAGVQMDQASCRALHRQLQRRGFAQPSQGDLFGGKQIDRSSGSDRVTLDELITDDQAHRCAVLDVALVDELRIGFSSAFFPSRRHPEHGRTGAEHSARCA